MMDGDFHKSTIWWEMADAALAAGLPLLTSDTAAKILAALLQFGGGNEAVVFSSHLRADLHYITERWGIKGGESPDPDMVEAIKRYREEMGDGEPPQWVIDLFAERYHVKLNTSC